MSWSRLSLLHGWVPNGAALIAWGTLGFGVAWSRRRAWHWLVIGAGALAAVLVLAWAVDIRGRVGSTYPRSFLAWAALPVFALGAAVWQWPAVRWWRRAVALAAVPALAVFCGLQINDHYAYLPTLGDLFRGPLPGQVDARSLDALSSGVDGSGRVVVMAAHTVAGGGVVAEIDIPSAVSRFRHRPAWVWLPPVYFTRPRPRLSVLMLISGTPGGPEDWLRGGGALTLANNWAIAHHGAAPIMVLPDANGGTFGDTECVDGPRGRAETYLSVDVPAFMHARFGVSTDPRRWAVAGLSEGGTCALTLVARHPSRFATFADFAGDPAPTIGSEATTLQELYGGSRVALERHNPTMWFGADATAGVGGFIAVGSSDRGHITAELQLVDAARAEHLPVQLDILNHEGHSFRAWREALRDAYAWIVQRLDPAARSPITLARAHHSRSPTSTSRKRRVLAASHRSTPRKRTR